MVGKAKLLRYLPVSIDRPIVIPVASTRIAPPLHTSDEMVADSTGTFESVLTNDAPISFVRV